MPQRPELAVVTDHKNITWLGSMKNHSGRLGRWVLRLAEYNAEVAYRKGIYLHVADCLSRNSLKVNDEGEIDDPIAGRMPRGLDAREFEERDFARKFGPPAAALAEPYVARGSSESNAVAEVVITEISPFDTDTPTTFMCEYSFKSGEERLQDEEEELENCHCAGTHPLEVRGGTRAQKSIEELEHAFQAFVATRSQLAKRSEIDSSPKEKKSDEANSESKSRHRAAKVSTDAARSNRLERSRGGNPSKGTRGAREVEEELGQHVDDEDLVKGEGAEGPSDPMIFGEEMIGEKLGHDEIRKAQLDDEFAQEMVERCKRARPNDKRASKFEMIDGALYRVTRSGDPQEGRESQRIYVPPALQAALMRNYHSTIWGKHMNSTSMHKMMVSWYYWNTMERDIQDYVSTCELCQLAKGTKPHRQGYLVGWKHSKVLHTVCMDLIGPIGTDVSGGRTEAKPRHILVITDPYSHMVWLEVLVTKSAEELYDKFVNRFLLEEGCPRVILTDNGREFKNVLLRDLMRLCRIRLRYTPPYHPRGNYTERVNRFIGESLRAMVNSPSGKKQDWFKLVKFVQFAYRRMYIPGTNLTPYMVARGRQPLSPNEMDLVDEEVALLSGASLSEHQKELDKNLKIATKLLTQAREATLREKRIQFNQEMIETVFEPGEIVRFYNHTVHRAGEPEEIASKWKLKNRQYIVLSREGSD